jgi:L-alanine-DL-glutamate epimerase-like enolase superfamily enzyme
VATPVQTSFGLMTDRPMVLVQAVDEDGFSGWGEVWCNFPQVGAEHRARLVDHALAPLACAEPFEHASALFDKLTRRTGILAMQCGEPGPFAQAIAGIDIAVWDLIARRQRLPLWRLLGGRSGDIGVYASGLNPTDPQHLAAQKQREGYTAFKQKIGFGRERDLGNLNALRRTLGDTATLMADANQAFELDEALAYLPLLEPYALGWLEEPLRADCPWPQWQQLRSAGSVPLAAGENLAGHKAFEAALGAGALDVVQPDLAKWGGFSACRALVPRIEAAGKRFCPHYLGGGIGLLASAHLLSTGDGTGLLEIDANPNPLRSLLAGPLNRISRGRADLGEAPGLGIEVDPESLAPFRVPHRFG